MVLAAHDSCSGGTLLPLDVLTLASRGSDSGWKGAFSSGICGVMFRAFDIGCGCVVVLEVAVLGSSDPDAG
jgi:hypothetical protein